MNKKKAYYYYSRGEAYSSELQAWIDAGTTAGHTLPSSTVLSALDTFLGTALETGTIISRMKTGYILHAGSKGMAKLNLKDPATYTLTESGTVTWSDGNGCKSDGASYFNQPFKCNEYAGIETDLSSINYVSESNTTSLNITPSGFKTTATTYFFLRTKGAATTGSRFSSTAASSNFNSSNHKGLYIQTYDGSNSVVYKDGAKTANAATPTVPNISVNRLILAYNGANAGVAAADIYTLYVSVDFLFNRFSDTDASNFKTAFDTYKTAVGLP